ncbi:radical SAM family heme chaperone HemW [Phenylobacterium montanum]|uniref:Heme chaperone HemW n=1 Tax=Phenylobacterium montanum TaxID=2823693 RepID=A0A975FX64_9CAUL|nr:radical SAM family heme chaperone HemW [Caulobacter sp. S6]QUD86472.1 coproporphyrinogen III oxidase [Caulobacter sp. S6]
MTEPAPLAVYVHWPYCAKVCPYCDFNVLRDRGQAEQAALAEAIVADLAGQAALTGPRRLISVFFGGGTPSLMHPAWAAAILDAAKRLWAPAEDLEVSMEANPTDAEAERFAAFAAAGVNRLSLGLQSLDDDALRFLGRNHDAAEARRAAALAARAFPRLSLDLIYARPGQAADAWADELRAALDLGPEHVSPYQLTIEPGTAFDRAVGRGRIVPPGHDLAASLYETTQAVLEGAGFEAYEVSNHARGPAARSRHNLAYWTGLDYVGAGPGAHGRLTAEGDRLATEAERRVGDYIAKVRTTGVGFAERETLSPREAAIERLLMGLRIDAGVAWPEIAALGLDAETPAVRELAGEGLLAPASDRLALTRRGRAVLDSVVRLLVEA